MARNDYASLVNDSLAELPDRSYMGQAAARFALSTLFYEAARAVSETRTTALSLQITELGDMFHLHSKAALFGPTVTFTRSGDRITVQASRVSTEALAGWNGTDEWFPSKSEPSELTEHAAAWIRRAVQVLARASR